MLENLLAFGLDSPHAVGEPFEFSALETGDEVDGCEPIDDIRL